MQAEVLWGCAPATQEGREHLLQWDDQPTGGVLQQSTALHFKGGHKTTREGNMGMAIGKKTNIQRDLENVNYPVLKQCLDFDSNKQILKYTFKR